MASSIVCSVSVEVSSEAVGHAKSGGESIGVSEVAWRVGDCEGANIDAN